MMYHSEELQRKLSGCNTWKHVENLYITNLQPQVCSIKTKFVFRYITKVIRTAQPTELTSWFYREQTMSIIALLSDVLCNLLDSLWKKKNGDLMHFLLWLTCARHTFHRCCRMQLALWLTMAHSPRYNSFAGAFISLSVRVYAASFFSNALTPLGFLWCKGSVAWFKEKLMSTHSIC